MILSVKTRSIAHLTPAAVVFLLCLDLTGCVSLPAHPMRADRYDIEVRLDPASHSLTGRTTLALVHETPDAAQRAGKPVAVDLLLHPGLKITRAAAGGTELRHRLASRRRTTALSKASDEHDRLLPRTHRITLDKPVPALTLTIDYEGTLFQDVSAGEKPGEVHNFIMRAHVSEEGIYLSGGGHWYPVPDRGEDAEPALADYTLVADPVEGLELVAGAERDREASDRPGKIVWHSPYPLDGMALVGGLHEVHQRVHDGITINLHLKPSQARHVEGLFDAVIRYLDRYQPLVGRYPAREYTIVDNFFSSGFAFPTFTLLASAVIDMGKRPQVMHGFIDHEMLHSWWGNGIHVDPTRGNWCEAITSYATNYYGYVLDGNLEDARRKRRNCCHFLSRIKPENDKPLSTFGMEDGAGRGIGYSKGTVVFHMLVRKIGENNFWAAMRRFTDEYVGKYASWDDIQRLCEQEGGLSLDAFFEQWVHGSGAPMLSIEQARYNASDRTLTLAMSQGKTEFDLEVPVRITHAEGTVDIEVPLCVSSGEVTVPVDVVPRTVEVDPDYHLFRKLARADAIPTTSATRAGDAFASVLPAGEVPESYETLKSIFESDFEEDERIALTTDDLEEDSLADRSVLIVAEAARDAQVAAFLDRIAFPVTWTDDGFVFDDIAYTDAGDAVLCTILRPGPEGRGVTVVVANSAEAFPRPNIIPMYDRGLVIFKNHRAVLRHDFERRHIVPVETTRNDE